MHFGNLADAANFTANQDLVAKKIIVYQFLKRE
jgi:hypothetical protein